MLPVSVGLLAFIRPGKFSVNYTENTKAYYRPAILGGFQCVTAKLHVYLCYLWKLCVKDPVFIILLRGRIY